MDIKGNRGWTRSTTATRRADRVANYLHVSKTYVAVNDSKGSFLRWQPLKGTTLEAGRNKAKRQERARKAASRGWVA